MKAHIVGGGFGGLAAAAYLVRDGHVRPGYHRLRGCLRTEFSPCRWSCNEQKARSLEGRRTMLLRFRAKRGAGPRVNQPSSPASHDWQSQHLAQRAQSCIPWLDVEWESGADIAHCDPDVDCRLSTVE
jgi:MCRA family